MAQRERSRIASRRGRRQEEVADASPAGEPPADPTAGLPVPGETSTGRRARAPRKNPASNLGPKRLWRSIADGRKVNRAAAKHATKLAAVAGKAGNLTFGNGAEVKDFDPPPARRGKRR